MTSSGQHWDFGVVGWIETVRHSRKHAIIIDEFFLPGQRFDCHLKKTDGWILLLNTIRLDLFLSIRIFIDIALQRRHCGLG